MSTTFERPTLIYDGDCGFCTSTARWASDRWTQPAIAVAWQQLGRDRLGHLGLSEWDVSHAAYWVDVHGRIARGHNAAAHALMAGPRWMRAAGLILVVPPTAWLARPAYWLIARYRHHLPGATEACRI